MVERLFRLLKRADPVWLSPVAVMAIFYHPTIFPSRHCGVIGHIVDKIKFIETSIESNLAILVS
jgi:hypothetical protein